MMKGYISNLIRLAGLLFIADRLRFYVQKLHNRKQNKAFVSENPDIPLPPDYLIYESFRINYKKYYTDSFETARWLADHFSKHTDLNKKRILDWGCGPGRIIRYLPDVIGNGCEYFGTDYNKAWMDWCRENLPGIEFNNNTLRADLPYDDDFFDIIYGISVFTHLSEKMHYEWYNELCRILKPGGILFLTTQGDNYRVKLTAGERQRYDKNEIIVRGNVKEGHRTFSAFHPVSFMHKLFTNAEILEHIVREPEKGKWLPQDTWIIRKPPLNKKTP